MQTREHIIYSPSARCLGLPRAFDGLLQIAPLLVARRKGAMTAYLRANLFTLVQVVVARLCHMRVVVEHNSWVSDERIMRNGSRSIAIMDQLSQIWSARLANHSRCVTPGIAKLLERHGVPDTKMTVVGNGTDVSVWNDTRKQDSGEKCITLGFIGVLSKWQGLETALEALAILRAKGIYRLNIVGDGPQRSVLEGLVDRLSLADQVSFIGQVEYSRAPTYVAEFDICIAPFTRERNEKIGLAPIKIRDYAAAGKPVVTSAIPGIVEFGGRGWLWTHEPDNPAALASTIDTLAARGRNFLVDAGGIARHYAERHFDWKQIAAEVEKLL